MIRMDTGDIEHTVIQSHSHTHLDCIPTNISILPIPDFHISATSQLSVGEIVNAMSTDVDRVVNFCNSFHACWSLPFQIAVSLFLLHREIQLAFLAGLAFAVLLIPINKVQLMFHVGISIGFLNFFAGFLLRT